MDDFLNEDVQQQQNNQFDDDEFGFEGDQQQEQQQHEDEEQQVNDEEQVADEEQYEQQNEGFQDDFVQQEQQEQQPEEAAYNYEEPVQATNKATPLQEWRQQKNKLIDEMDTASRAKKKEIREEAEKYIEQFLAEREDKKASQHKNNVEAEELFVQTNQVGSDNVWENVLKYVDIHGGAKKQGTTNNNEESLDDLDKVDLSFKKTKGQQASADTQNEISVREAENKDVSRMRKILLTLKNQPLAQPTA